MIFQQQFELLQSIPLLPLYACVDPAYMFRCLALASRAFYFFVEKLIKSKAGVAAAAATGIVVNFPFPKCFAIFIVLQSLFCNLYCL